MFCRRTRPGRPSAPLAGLVGDVGVADGVAELLSSSPRRCSKLSETYLRKSRPRTRCLYSAASTLPRSMSADFHSDRGSGRSDIWMPHVAVDGSGSGPTSAHSRHAAYSLLPGSADPLRMLCRLIATPDPRGVVAVPRAATEIRFTLMACSCRVAVATSGRTYAPATARCAPLRMRTPPTRCCCRRSGSRPNSQRRALVAAAEETVDTADPACNSGCSQPISTVSNWEFAGETVHADGYDDVLVPRHGVLVRSLRATARQFAATPAHSCPGALTTLAVERFNRLGEPRVLLEHLARIEAGIAANPAAAIASAKELVQARCKFVLDDYGVSYKRTASLPDLYGAAATELRLTREAVPGSVKGSPALPARVAELDDGSPGAGRASERAWARPWPNDSEPRPRSARAFGCQRRAHRRRVRAGDLARAKGAEGVDAAGRPWSTGVGCAIAVVIVAPSSTSGTTWNPNLV